MFGVAFMSLWWEFTHEFGGAPIENAPIQAPGTYLWVNDRIDDDGNTWLESPRGQAELLRSIPGYHTPLMLGLEWMRLIIEVKDVAILQRQDIYPQSIYAYGGGDDFPESWWNHVKHRCLIGPQDDGSFWWWKMRVQRVAHDGAALWGKAYGKLYN